MLQHPSGGQLSGKLHSGPTLKAHLPAGALVSLISGMTQSQAPTAHAKP